VRIYPGHAEWKAVEQHLDRLLDMDETPVDGHSQALRTKEPAVTAT
jgi:hypothetical protein